MTRTWMFAFASLAFVILCCLTQEASGQGDTCSTARNCSECLDAGTSCRWCADRHVMWQNRRCAGSAGALAGCQEFYNPQGFRNTTMNKELKGEVQVSPQEFFISMRPGQRETLRVTLKPRANYPLDVYYLMDHSYSFQNDLESLKKNSVKLAQEISRISLDYQLGFGSFVDKMIAPNALTYQNVPVQQCALCKKGYSFHNTFPLRGRASSAFQAAVMEQKISANIDNPEGILDGMMQVAVCDEIRWRPKARKVMIVATDANYHSAGDGKLSGIVHFNDGKCHLDRNGFYSESLNQDYPSVGWLNTRLLDNSIFTIFAVIENVTANYESLSKRILDSRVVTLTADSSNLVEIVKAELEKLVKEGKITVFPDFGVDIAITANCPNNEVKIDPVTNFPTCTGLSTGSEATFNIELTARKCDELRKLDSLTIRFVGYGDVVVNIKPLCSCECENHPVVTRDWCGPDAEDHCAICKCKEGFVGEFCNCTLSIDPCIQPGTNKTCSDRGKCVCGKCICKPQPQFRSFQRVWGEFCECDNISCPMDADFKLCGGPERGVCNCSCVCIPPYFGPACNCTVENDTCVFPGENRVCRGNGVCECGECKCFEGFNGIWCQNCTAVNNELEQCKDICIRSNHCLKCGLQDREGECKDCNGYRSIVSPGQTHTILVGSDRITATRCEATDEDGCLIVYWVAEFAAENATQRYFAPLEIESDTKKCPKPVNYLPLILGIVFGLLLLGLLLLLLWRALISLKDRKEYNRFVKGRDSSQPMGENPLFKNPKQNFDNPAFGR